MPVVKAGVLLIFFRWVNLNFQNALFFGIIGGYIISLLLWEFLKPAGLTKKFDLSLVQQQMERGQKSNKVAAGFLLACLLLETVMLIYFFHFKEVLPFEAGDFQGLNPFN